MNRPPHPLAGPLARVTGFALGPYQTAMVRIGFALTWLLFLLREFPNRHELYGPDGTWSWQLAHRLIDVNHAFTALMWSDSTTWFEIVYVLAMISSALLLFGWHTRAMSVLFMIGVLSLQNRSVFVGDGGDNVLHLMSLYLVLTRCGQVWSLDARRARRVQEARERGVRAAEPGGPVLWAVLGFALLTVTLLDRLSNGWLCVFYGLWLIHGLWWLVGRLTTTGGELRGFLDVVANVVHNAALLVIMAEACLIYSTAGWYKIQGSRWQDGTAVYYPLHLDYFSPWPALSHQMASYGLPVLLITYGTVIVQVAFPFTLFNRRVKNVLLALMICEHAVIAVVLGLPFFSLAMIAADSVFLPTSFLVRVGRLADRLRLRLFPSGHHERPRSDAPYPDAPYPDGPYPDGPHPVVPYPAGPAPEGPGPGPGGQAHPAPPSAPVGFTP